MSHVVRALAALALAVASCFSPAALALDTGDIVVTSLKGEVHLTVNGAERALKPGGVLETPSSIRTGRDGAIELKQGATTVSVGPDSLLEFPAQEKRGGAIDRIVQPRGNAFYGVGKRDGRKLRVETPYLVGVVKGTQFNVAAQDDSTTISLFEGRLEVHATDESDVVDLNAGEIATRKRGAKSITILKMDGKAPTTAPRPATGTGGNVTPGSPAGNPARGADDDSVLAGGARANPVIATTVDTVNGAVSANAGASLDVRANAAELNANASGGVSVGEGAAVNVGAGANVADAGANVTAGVTAGASGVDAGATLNATTPVAGVDAGVTAAVGASGVDASAALSVTAPAASVDAGASVSVGTGGGAADVGAAVAAPAVDVTTSTSLGVTPGAVDLTTSTGVAAGPVTTDTAANTAVDVGTSGVTAAVGAGATAVVGAQPVVDATTSITAAVTPATTTAAIDTSASIPADTGVAAAVNATAGSVDLGVNVAGANANAGVDLGLGSNSSTSTTTSTTTTTPTPETPATPVIDVGGLLDGLLRRRGK